MTDLLNNLDKESKQENKELKVTKYKLENMITKEITCIEAAKAWAPSISSLVEREYETTIIEDKGFAEDLLLVEKKTWKDHLCNVFCYLIWQTYCIPDYISELKQTISSRIRDIKYKQYLITQGITTSEQFYALDFAKGIAGNFLRHPKTKYYIDSPSRPWTKKELNDYIDYTTHFGGLYTNLGLKNCPADMPSFTSFAKDWLSQEINKYLPYGPFIFLDDLIIEKKADEFIYITKKIKNDRPAK